MRYEESTLIDAPIELIWRLTTHIEDWPAFLPSVQRVERLDAGELRVGSSARMKQPGQTTAVWTVTRVEPEREFTWETNRPGARLTGRHLLESVGSGTRMTLVLEVTGSAAGLTSLLFGGMMRKALRQEAAGFTRQATAVR